MLENLPVYIPAIFIITTFISFGFLYAAIKHSVPKANNIALCLLLWLALQGLLSLKGIYSTDTRTMPPKFFLAVMPPLLTIIILFATKKGRNFIDALPLKTLTYLHVVRIPVELVLYWLFLYKTIPVLMTFEGRNFDIQSGITAPIVAYLALKRKPAWNRILLAWNFLALGLLINIVVNAVLAAPFAFQQLAFDQPNVAVLYFPFVLLPAFIVPAVLFSHLVSIRQLLKR